MIPNRIGLDNYWMLKTIDTFCLGTRYAKTIVKYKSGFIIFKCAIICNDSSLICSPSDNSGPSRSAWYCHHWTGIDLNIWCPMSLGRDWKQQLCPFAPRPSPSSHPPPGARQSIDFVKNYTFRWCHQWCSPVEATVSCTCYCGREGGQEEQIKAQSRSD